MRKRAREKDRKRERDKEREGDKAIVTRETRKKESECESERER